MLRTQSLTSMLVVACALAGTAGCGGDSAIAPDAVPLQAFEGTRNIAASSVVVVLFQIDQSGTVRTAVDWNNFLNDIDTAILQGTCTADQIVQGTTAGCPNHDALVQDNATALAFDDNQVRKPSALETPVTAGVHTLVVWNFSMFQNEVFAYRIEAF